MVVAPAALLVVVAAGPGAPLGVEPLEAHVGLSGNRHPPGARLAHGFPRTAYNPALPVSLAPGSTLGPYTIRAQLGSGGMGVVYLAHDPNQRPARSRRAPN